MSNLTEYDIGDTVRLSCTFTVGSTVTNPTTQSVVVTKPDGTSTTYSTPTQDSTGVFHQDVVVDQSGEWTAQWTGTGAVAAASANRFAVRRAGA